MFQWGKGLKVQVLIELDYIVGPWVFGYLEQKARFMMKGPQRQNKTSELQPEELHILPALTLNVFPQMLNSLSLSLSLVPSNAHHVLPHAVFFCQQCETKQSVLAPCGFLSS